MPDQKISITLDDRGLVRVVNPGPMPCYFFQWYVSPSDAKGDAANPRYWEWQQRKDIHTSGGFRCLHAGAFVITRLAPNIPIRIECNYVVGEESVPLVAELEFKP